MSTNTNLSDIHQCAKLIFELSDAIINFRFNLLQISQFYVTRKKFCIKHFLVSKPQNASQETRKEGQSCIFFSGFRYLKKYSNNFASFR
jgi:hypothetical protein